MAAKILANLIVLGSGIVLRAVSQAWRQAIINGQRSGVAEQVANQVKTRGSKAMTIQEARQILGIEPTTDWEKTLERYKMLYERNETGGSFYIQSKVVRAKEALEEAREAEKGKT